MYLAQNLKCLRKQKGMNQNEMAGIIGTSPSAVGMWESGRRQPCLEIIIKLADYFEVTIDGLIRENMRPQIPTYSENLRFLREKHKMTQKDIAELLGVSQRCISKYENGEITPTIDNFVKLSDFFGITLDQLVKQDMTGGEWDGSSSNGTGSYQSNKNICDSW